MKIKFANLIEKKSINTETQYFQVAIKELEVKEDGYIYIEGYASTNDIDRHGDIVSVDCWRDKKSVTDFEKNPVLLLQHNADKVLGQVTERAIDDKGLSIKATVKYDIDGSKEKIANGDMKGFSIGFTVSDYDYVQKDTMVSLADMTGEEIDKLTHKDVIRIIKGLSLAEISVVSIPSNPNTLFTLSKSMKKYFTDMEAKELETEEEDLAEEVEEEVQDTVVEEVKEEVVEEVKELDEEEEVVAEIATPDEVVTENVIAEEEVQKSLEVIEKKAFNLSQEIEQKELAIVSLNEKQASLLQEIEQQEAKLLEIKGKIKSTPVELALSSHTEVTAKKKIMSMPESVSFYKGSI